MWRFCVPFVLILLVCAGAADAVPAHVGVDWRYGIGLGNTDFVGNAGSLQGTAEIFFGPGPDPFVSFDITAGDVHLAAGFNPKEDIPCSAHAAGFSFTDGTAAISGFGRGCAVGVDHGAAFGMTAFNLDDLEVSLGGSTSDITSALMDISGSAVMAVSEPADFALLALGAGLLALHFSRRTQRGERPLASRHLGSR